MKMSDSVTEMQWSWN